MKGIVYYNDKDLLAKKEQIQCQKKIGKKTLVEHASLAKAYI